MAALIAIGLLAVRSNVPAGSSALTLTTEVVCADGSTGCGTVQPSSASCKRNCVVPIEARPNTASGWVFDRWEGAASGSDSSTKVRLTSSGVAIAYFAKADSGGGGGGTTPSDREVVGYFIQWGVYRRNYLVRDIVATGAAGTLTTINYAFAGIDETLRCTSLDPFADWGKRFDAAERVDGQADTVAQPLKGNFNQLWKLKQKYPQIRVLISIGGWNDSARFSDAALPANREAFVQSCVDMFVKGQFDPANGVTGTGVFDGIDIDWEYPGACGATCHWRPEDTENFTALLQEFRTQLDAAGAGRHYLLTAATPASAELHAKMQLEQVATVLDWMNIMTYDFHGAWEPSGPTNHQSNLYAGRSGELSADGVVGTYLGKGVPAGRIVIGLPSYGRGWGSVPGGGTHGLYQKAGRIPRGTWEQGVEDYKVLKTKGYPEYWGPDARASWLYNGSEFWTFDSPAAIGAKMGYISTHCLRGAMFWELSGDDGTLVQAIAKGPGPVSDCPPVQTP